MFETILKTRKLPDGSIAIVELSHPSGLGQAESLSFQQHILKVVASMAQPDEVAA